MVDRPDGKKGKRAFKGGAALAVYFAGHGVFIDATTHILISDTKKGTTINFPLEDDHRKFTRYLDGRVYTMAFYDCCRVIDSDKDKKNRDKLLSDSDYESSDEDTLASNLIQVFGCPPSMTVDAKSDLLERLTKRIEKRAA